MEFSDVCIFTENVIEMAEYYEEIFDVEADKDKIHSVLKAGGLTIAFYDKNHAESVMGFDFSESGNGMTYIGFNVNDLDEVYKRLKVLDITKITKPKIWPWGAKSFNFTDLDGNRIMFRSWIED